MDRHNRPRFRSAGDAALAEQHVAHLFVVQDHDGDDVGRGRDIRGSCDRLCTFRGKLLARFRERVAHDQTAGMLDEMRRHRRAHLTEADEAEGAHERNTCPPSTLKICPVIQDASSDNKNKHSPTRSSGVPIRASGSCETIWSMIWGGTVSRVASVSIGPGAIALMRIADPPSSRASCCVSPLMPTFATP